MAVSPNEEVGLAVVGLGYWGPNLVRNAFELPDVRMVAACDADMAALAPLGRRYPGLKLTTSLDEVLADPDVDGVPLATPISTHLALGLRVLEAGKHAFIEKPLAETPEDATALIEAAARHERVLMVGHTFLYSPPVNFIKAMLDSGELGDIYFATSSRVNLGIHQSGASVVRDLAPHDFSILHYWFGEPSFVRAIGRSSVVPGTLDVVFIDIGYSNGLLIHLELSWLSPTKLRRTVLVGSEKMVVYEDTSDEQIRVFDRGVDVIEPQSFGEYQLSYRSGDVLTPRLDADEPLRVEVADFAHCIRTGQEPRSNGESGLAVARMMQATEASLEWNGAPAALDTGSTERRSTPDRRRNVGGMPVVPQQQSDPV
jgi:predicted dehydrogenase